MKFNQSITKLTKSENLTTYMSVLRACMTLTFTLHRPRVLPRLTLTYRSSTHQAPVPRNTLPKQLR